MAAAFLAQRGYDVVLFERRRHPRYQVGESVIPHIWKYCDKAGVAKKLKAEGFVKKVGGTVVWDGVIRQTAFGRFGYKEPALHVERDRFDAILMEHCRAEGARVFEETTVAGADFGDDDVRVRFSSEGDGAGAISARYLVDASGQSALLAKQLGVRVIDDAFRFMSVWGYFEGSKYVGLGGVAHPFEKLAEIPPTTFVCDIPDTDGWGWAWHIPLRKTTSVGLVVPREALKAVTMTESGLEPYFLRMCTERLYVRKLLSGARFVPGSLHVTRDYSYLPTMLAGPRFFLAGDAAAFTDPIFSIGVVIAMSSAYMSAWAIDEAFKRPATANRNRALYETQMRSWVEVSRALALPRHSATQASNLVRDGMKFASSTEQELMHVVSMMTTRSDNYRAMAGTTSGPSSSNNVWELPEIQI
jgi:flavin-dependent dehydrogenase